MARKAGAGAFAIHAEGEGRLGDVALGTAMQPARPADLPRRSRAGAQRQSLLDHLGLLWLTPDQDGLFRGAAGDRRRFLIVSFLPSTLTMRAAPAPMRTRYGIAIACSRMSAPDSHWLDAIEREIAEIGTALAAAAACETVIRLDAMGRADAAAIAPFPFAILRLEGDVEQRLSSEKAGAVEDWFRAGPARQSLAGPAGGSHADRSSGK